MNVRKLVVLLCVLLLLAIGMGVINYLSGQPFRDLEEQRELARREGIPLTLKDALAKLPPNRGLDATKEYEALLGLISKKNELVEPYSGFSMNDLYEKWRNAKPANMARAQRDLRTYLKRYEKVWPLAEVAGSRDYWKFVPGKNDDLKIDLNLVSVCEWLCARASLDAAEGRSELAAKRFASAWKIGCHLIGQGPLIQQMNGELIEAIVQQSIAFLVKKRTSSKGILRGLHEVLSMHEPTLPPDLNFELECAQHYEWSFRKTTSDHRKWYERVLEIFKSSGYSPVRAETVWLREIRGVRRELRVTKYQWPDIVACLRKHAPAVDAVTATRRAPVGLAFAKTGDFSVLAWLFESTSKHSAQLEAERLALLKLVENKLRDFNGGPRSHPSHS